MPIECFAFGCSEKAPKEEREYYSRSTPDANPEYEAAVTETSSTPNNATDAETTVPWQQNPLHDLESLFWLSDEVTINRDLYFVLPGRPNVEVYAPEADETVQVHRERLLRQGYAAQSLRPNHLDRHMNLMSPDFFARNLATLQPLLQPRNSDPRLRSVSETLEKFRGCLVERYHEAEQDPAAITNLVADGLYYTVAESLSRAASSFKMFNHIACTRPLALELYKLSKQDTLIKDINERTSSAAKGRRAGFRRGFTRTAPFTSVVYGAEEPTDDADGTEDPRAHRRRASSGTVAEPTDEPDSTRPPKRCKTSHLADESPTQDNDEYGYHVTRKY